MNEIFDNKDVLIISISAVISFLATTVFFLIQRNRSSKTYYDFQKQKVELDKARELLESPIYNMNGILTNTDEKWKDINHLLLNKTKGNVTVAYNQKQINLNKFLIEHGVSEDDLFIDKKLIFLLTPFNSEFEKDYRVLKDVCSDFGLNIVRGDEEHFSGDIFPQILKKILKSNLVIANINGRNSNVLYELGIAQALDKPTILIAKRDQSKPIDIQSKKFLIYRNYAELSDLLKKELVRVFSET